MAARWADAEQLLAQVQQALHGALAVGGVVADDQAAAVVLDGAGEDFAGAGAELADQHHQRSRPGHARLRVVQVLHAAVGVFHLHHRPLVDEQPGEADGLVERAAAVAAQVEDHRVDVLAVEVVENVADVAGGALEVGHAAAVARHVAVEAGQVDHADAVRRAVGLPAGVEHLALRLAVLQLDLLADDLVDLSLRAVAGNHFQADRRAPLAADQLHDVVELHVDHVDHLALVVLADADDLVLDLEPAVLVGGAAGDDLLDHRVAVLAHQRGPDPLQLQAHGDVEVLLRVGRHVVGMRIERRGEGVQIHLQQLVAVDLVHPLGEAVVAPGQLVEGLLPSPSPSPSWLHASGSWGIGLSLLRSRLPSASSRFLLVRLQHQQIVLDPLPPAVAGLGRIAGILGRVAVDHHLLVRREIVRHGQQLVDHLHPLVHPLQERAKHRIGEADVALARSRRSTRPCAS